MGIIFDPSDGPAPAPPAARAADDTPPAAARRRPGFGLWRSLAGGRHRGPPSAHFDGTEFRNPSGETGKSLLEAWRWSRTRQPAPWPAWRELTARPDLPRTLAAGEFALTFVNHVTFLGQFRGLTLLTDPVWSERVSPFRRLGPKRVHAPGLALEALPPLDLVLVSHDHYDHLDVATLQALARGHRATFVTGLGNAGFLAGLGIGPVLELDWWQSAAVAGARVTFVPAQHWSARSPFRRNRTLWGGFVVEHDGRRLYFAGDTGAGPHFAALRARLGPPDVSLLPIGAYAPRWFMRGQHMDPYDAVRAHLELESRMSIGTHFGCFQLTDEGIDEPLVHLDRARREAGVSAESFPVLEPGETRHVR
jgi:L-ascorbate metabolism protein UlaG (beta-lactamase superfamily)